MVEQTGYYVSLVWPLLATCGTPRAGLKSLDFR